MHPFRTLYSINISSTTPFNTLLQHSLNTIPSGATTRRTVSPEVLPHGDDTPLVIASSMVHPSEDLMCVDKENVDKENAVKESAEKDSMGRARVEQDGIEQIGVKMTSEDEQYGDISALEGGCAESKHCRH